MKDKKSIVIAGGTGLVGKHLVQFLDNGDYDIYILTRNPRPQAGNIQYIEWNPLQFFVHPTLKKADFIINLAGEGIADKRWTPKRKRELVESRTQSALTLQKWIQKRAIKPELYIGASAVGFYGDRGNDILTEDSFSGNEFMSNICQSWEVANQKSTGIVERLVILRIGIVLSLQGGALPKLLMTKRFGFLSYFGNGAQYAPWIHINDLCQIMLTCIQNPGYNGIYNAVAPQEITNKKSMLDLKKILPNIFMVLPVPSFVLKLFLGEMSKVVLNSNRVIPKRLLDSGFSFSFVDFGQAVKSLLGGK